MHLFAEGEGGQRAEVEPSKGRAYSLAFGGVGVGRRQRNDTIIANSSRDICFTGRRRAEGRGVSLYIRFGGIVCGGGGGNKCQR